jgi:sporulation related protein
MQPLRPVAGSAKKVYIARGGKQGAPATLSSSAGEGVQFVDEPGLADEIVAIHVGSNRIDRATAKRLQKACLAEQRRQERGKKDKGVFDQIIADLEGPSVKKERQQASDGGFSFVVALVLSGVVWAGLCLYMAREQNIGVAFVSLLLGVAMVPLLATVLKLFDAFMPSGLMTLGVLGLCVLVWGAAIGVIDVERRHHRQRQAAGPVAMAGGEAKAGFTGDTATRFGDNPEEAGAQDTAAGHEDWPRDLEAYTVIVASKRERSSAQAFADRAAQVQTPAGVLRSDGYTTLLPGYWVAFAGRFDTAKQALAEARRLRGTGFDGAYAELIAGEPQPPSGTITASSLGSLRVGMTVGEVQRYVTAPDAEQAVNFGGGPTPEFDWTWRFDDGDVTLEFDNGTGELAGIVATTRAVATTSGLRVGDSFASIQRRYGDQLRTSPIGAGLRILSEGRPGTYPALMFVVRSGVVESIAGGLPKPAGE